MDDGERLSKNGGVPPRLRLKIALVVLLGAFLIPVATSSLRGLTHILTCSDPEEIPFTLVADEADAPVIASSETVTRDVPRACGGLVHDLAARLAEPGKVALVLSITNETDHEWHGTVKLKVGETTVPVHIGSISPRNTGVDTVKVKTKPGSLDVNGSLLVGP